MYDLLKPKLIFLQLHIRKTHKYRRISSNYVDNNIIVEEVKVEHSKIRIK